VNTAGWIVTAAHVFDTAIKADDDAPKVAELRARMDEVRSDPTLQPGFANRQVKRLEVTAGRDWITNHSYWWGRDGVTVRDVTILAPAGIAVARLDPVPVDMVASPPVFKNPARNVLPGTGLCRLGYPFAGVGATYDAGDDAFTLNATLPLFPLDGIVTRTVRTAETTPGGTPIQFLETSSPGLKGQSGGPMIDTAGRVWAIQSRTRSIPLDLNPEVPVSGRRVAAPQVLNLGQGVHPQTLADLFSELGVRFEMSAD
jgi:hypothetical protein